MTCHTLMRPFGQLRKLLPSFDFEKGNADRILFRHVSDPRKRSMPFFFLCQSYFLKCFLPWTIELSRLTVFFYINRHTNSIEMSLLMKATKHSLTKKYSFYIQFEESYIEADTVSKSCFALRTADFQPISSFSWKKIG